MSEPLQHFCNREFIEELCELRERNVLLLFIDGSAAFGRIVSFDDYVIRLLPPIGIAGVSNVLFRPPNPTLGVPILSGELLIDVCNVAHVVEGPFVTAPIIF